MATLQETKKALYHKYHPVMIVSAYRFVIAIASFLFLYLGFKIDQYFDTAPNFMFGMFFLALFLSIGRLYQEAWRKRKEV
jgi:F0F1-type ATP synthase assembly protein I